jgi:hypothetical protein
MPSVMSDFRRIYSASEKYFANLTKQINEKQGIKVQDHEQND